MDTSEILPPEDLAQKDPLEEEGVQSERPEDMAQEEPEEIYGWPLPRSTDLEIVEGDLELLD